MCRRHDTIQKKLARKLTRDLNHLVIQEQHIHSYNNVDRRENPLKRCTQLFPDEGAASPLPLHGVPVGGWTQASERKVLNALGGAVTTSVSRLARWGPLSSLSFDIHPKEIGQATQRVTHKSNTEAQPLRAKGMHPRMAQDKSLGVADVEREQVVLDLGIWTPRSRRGEEKCTETW